MGPCGVHVKAVASVAQNRQTVVGHFALESLECNRSRHRNAANVLDDAKTKYPILTPHVLRIPVRRDVERRNLSPRRKEARKGTNSGGSPFLSIPVQLADVQRLVEVTFDCVGNI